MAKKRFRTSDIANESHARSRQSQQTKRSQDQSFGLSQYQSQPQETQLHPSHLPFQSRESQVHPSRVPARTHVSQTHPSWLPTRSRDSRVELHVPSRPQQSQCQDQVDDDDFDEESTDDDVDEVETIDSKGIRNTRGITRMSDVWNLPVGKKIVLNFNGAFQPVDKEAGIFSRFIGTVARKPHLCPIKYLTWRKLPMDYKEECWKIIEAKFEMPEDENSRLIIKHNTLQSLSEKWRNHKQRLKKSYYNDKKTPARIVAEAPSTVNQEDFADLVNYWFSEKGQRISLKNKKNREKQKEVHTAGSKSYAQYAHDMKKNDGVAPNRSVLYKVVRTRKNGSIVSDDVRANIEKMEELMSTQPSNLEPNENEGIAWAPNDIYAQVMGPEKRGRVRGVGFGPNLSNKSGGTRSTLRGIRMISEEDRQRDKEEARELKNELAIIKEQMASLIRVIRQQPYTGFQGVNVSSVGVHDEHSPHAQRSSVGSYENEHRGNNSL